MKIMKIVTIKMSEVMKTAKVFVRVALVIALVLVAIFVYRFLKSKSLSLNEVEEFETSITVQEVKQISELSTASYYGETALKRNKGFFGRQEIVVVSSGKVRAGFDLSGLTENDFRCEGDTLYLDLPEAEILDVIVNPSDTKIFTCKGDWSQEEVNALVSEARRKIEQDAINHGVLKLANDKAVEKLGKVFQSFGFEEVRISIVKKTDTTPSLKDVEQ